MLLIKQSKNVSATWTKNCLGKLMIKASVRGSTIKHACKKKKNTDSTIKTLTNEINDLDMTCKDNPNDETLRAKLKGKKHILEDICHEKAQGIYIRSKAQLVKVGKKSSKYCLNLEIILRRTVIHKLIVDGKDINNWDDIFKAEGNFYQNLYSESDTDDGISLWTLFFFSHNVDFKAWWWGLYTVWRLLVHILKRMLECSWINFK